MAKETGITVSESQLSRILRKLGARWGRAKPIVLCPWKRAARNRRLGQLRRLAENVRTGEVVLYEDEVDIHLNPKIGRDWMVKGQQKKVITPGKNQKRYVAGVLDAQTGRMVWASGTNKNSLLFIELLKKVLAAYPHAKTIHLILDNYRIHRSRQVDLWMEQFGQRLDLHWLPPYCPDDNRIERRSKDLHAAVTTNHQHDNIENLMDDVQHWLKENGKARVGTYRKAI